jgi:GT2 family glycosyltransferase
VAVVELPESGGFTAGKARNAGLRALLGTYPSLKFVQMLDGDCELLADWLIEGLHVLTEQSDVAVVFGGVRERYPEASFYNALCDREWRVPVGEAAACGGIALFRVEAIDGEGGYAEDLVAGEEPELCLRLRRSSWRILRVPGEMTVHDADMHHFKQWWRRSVRGGFGISALAWRYKDRADRVWKREVLSTLAWAAFAPGAALVLLFFYPFAALVVLSIYPIQIIRIFLREGDYSAPAFGLRRASMLMLGKFAQLQGLMVFIRTRFLNRPRSLKEHKISSS